MALVDHPDGAAHLGAWYAIVECASRQKIRGNLPGGISQDAGGISQGIGGICRALGRISQLPPAVFESAIPRLLRIGWIEEFEYQDVGTRAQDHRIDSTQVNENKESPTALGESASIVAESADDLGKKRRHITGNNITGKGTTVAAAQNGNDAPLLPLLPSIEYALTIAEIRKHDPSADEFLCVKIATATAQYILSHPRASQLSEDGKRDAVSDRIIAKACAASYENKPKNHGTGLLLTTVPRIITTWGLNGSKRKTS